MRRVEFLIGMFLLLFGCAVEAQSVGGGSTGHPTIIVNDGDSLSTSFASPTGTTFPSLAVGDLASGLVVPINVAVNGETVATNLSTFSQHVAPAYNSNIPFLVFLLSGGNDIRGGASAATIYGNIQSYVSAVHALGPAARVVVSSYLVQCDIFNNSTWKGVLQTLNNTIIPNWNVAQGSGGLGADGFANFWADPTIGPNTYASSAFCSPAISPDGQHGSDSTRAIMGQIMANSVLQFLR